MFIRGEDVSPFTTPTLQSVVEQSLNGVLGKYAVFIKNLKTDESYKRNQDIEFELGSLYKIWLMRSVMEELKSGQLNEDERIVENIASLNKRFNIASEEAEFKGGEVEFSVNSALEQMITISHNYAALSLLARVGDKNIPKKVMAEEVALFFEGMYKGEMIDWEYSQKMLELLSRQKINDRIPKYLPAGTKVAHKTGDIGYFEHDAGIIYTAKGDYIIVVLTESNSPSDADEKIAQISKAVYEYFSKER